MRVHALALSAAAEARFMKLCFSLSRVSIELSNTMNQVHSVLNTQTHNKKWFACVYILLGTCIHTLQQRAHRSTGMIICYTLHLVSLSKINANAHTSPDVCFNRGGGGWKMNSPHCPLLPMLLNEGGRERGKIITMMAIIRERGKKKKWITGQVPTDWLLLIWWNAISSVTSAAASDSCGQASSRHRRIELSRI